jgi:hypothetical protein
MDLAGYRAKDPGLEESLVMVETAEAAGRSGERRRQDHGAEGAARDAALMQEILRRRNSTAKAGVEAELDETTMQPEA